MAELTIREIEPAIVAKLRQRAQQHGRTVEEEHRTILRETLLKEDESPLAMTFEAYLRTMPDVGSDVDFARIEGAIREVALGD